jgi:hypothetical protein
MQFQDMTGMTVSFKLKDRERVVVMFSAVLGQGSGASPGRSAIRLLIDGREQVVGQGGEVDAHQGDQVSLDGFNFISDVLEPGKHTAVIQWRSQSGGQVCNDERSLIVLHN